MTWGVATALLEQRGDEGLFEVDEAWLPRVADAARPAPDRARQPLPRPARPLRRAGDAGRRVGGAGRAAAPAAPASSLNADDPLIADLGRDREERPRPGRHLLRHRRPLAGAARAPARPRRQALPPLRAPLRTTSAPSSATSATTPVRTAAPAARAPTSPRPRSSCAGCAARASPSAPRRASCGWSCRCPASTTSTTRSRRSPPASELGIEPARIGRGAGRTCRAAFGRVETIEVAGVPVSILLIKNPAGANEVLRTLRLEPTEGGARPLDRAQRPDRRRPRRLLDLGRRLRAAGRRRAAGRLRRHARRRRWRCASSTRAGRRDAIEVEPRDRRIARPGRRRGPPAASSRCPPTPRCSSCARCSPIAAWRGSTGSERGGAEPSRPEECGDLARPRVRRLCGRPAALGARLRPTAAAGAVLDLGCGTGRVALHLARRGHRRGRGRPRAGASSPS